MENKRLHSIDLLRIVATYMICLIHVLNQGGVLRVATQGRLAYWFLFSVVYCAVNIYGIISGYVDQDKPQNYTKLALMWLQVVFFGFILCAVAQFVGYHRGTPIIQHLFPLISNSYWYFTAYVPLYLVKPYLNKIFNDIDEKKGRELFWILIVLTCLINFLSFDDTFKLNYGYSTLWLIVLYIIGKLLRKAHIFEKWSSVKLIGLLILLNVIQFIPYELYGDDIFYNYTSFTVVFSGIIFVVLFSRMKIESNLISKLSGYTLGIYLFQNNQFVWEYLYNRFVFVAKYPALQGMLYVFLIALAIFAIGFVLEAIRKVIVFFNQIDDTVDYLLSRKKRLENGKIE